MRPEGDLGESPVTKLVKRSPPHRLDGRWCFIDVMSPVDAQRPAATTFEYAVVPLDGRVRVGPEVGMRWLPDTASVGFGSAVQPAGGCARQ